MVAQQDAVPVGRLFVIGLVGIVLTYVAVLLLSGLYHREETRQWRDKVVAVPHLESETVLAEQKAANRSYGVVDSEAGTYQIPVERAIDLFVAERSED